MIRRMSRGQKSGAFSLLEAVIAVFLLSYAALSVLSLTQSGFVAQKRNQEIAKANLVAQSVISDIRMWAEDINNYKGTWGAYNTTITPVGFPEYQVTVRARAAGRPIDSPCAELESQWEPTPREKRTMRNAIVPVEVKVSWSDNPRDQLTVLTYVGEPRRDVSRIRFNVVGPNPHAIGVGQEAMYSVSATDGSGRGLDNIMFLWVPDIRYLGFTERARRDGREFEVTRFQSKPPDPPPPSIIHPTCYAIYAGEYLTVNVPGLQLP